MASHRQTWGHEVGILPPDKVKDRPWWSFLEAKISGRHDTPMRRGHVSKEARLVHWPCPTHQNLHSWEKQSDGFTVAQCNKRDPILAKILLLPSKTLEVKLSQNLGVRWPNKILQHKILFIWIWWITLSFSSNFSETLFHVQTTIRNNYFEQEQHRAAFHFICFHSNFCCLSYVCWIPN